MVQNELWRRVPQDNTEAPGWTDLEQEFKWSEAALAENYEHHDPWFDEYHDIHIAPLLPDPAAPLLSPGSLAEALNDEGEDQARAFVQAPCLADGT